jgi:hypothetical protein
LRAEVTPLVDVVDGGGENLKGFTFDTDGTLYLISRWAPQLFSLTPAHLTQPVNRYGEYRFSPSDSALPIDSLVMIYTPLPNQNQNQNQSRHRRIRLLRPPCQQRVLTPRLRYSLRPSVPPAFSRVSRSFSLDAVRFSEHVAASRHEHKNCRHLVMGGRAS